MITFLGSDQNKAHALRTFYPDVDIPADFMREQLMTDAGLTEDLSTFDPYSGTMMDVLYHANQGTGLLAFPMGETNADLSEPSTDVMWRADDAHNLVQISRLSWYRKQGE